MDDETSSHIRDAVRDAVLRGRPPADTEATKQQMLASTLRLAGHTVELVPGVPVSPRATDRPDDTARADGAEGPDETLPAETPDSGNPLADADLDQFDEAALSPVSAAQAALPSNSLEIMPIDEARSSAWSVDSAADGALPGSDTLPSGDAQPAWSVVAAGDPAETARSPAPGSTVAQPDSGAGSFSDPASACGECGSGGGGGGRTPSDGTGADYKSQSGDAAGTDPISIDVTPVGGDEIGAEVMQKVAAVIEAKVGQRIDELRHEAYVSRAAWNALFPR